MKFKRYLSQNMINALNEEYKRKNGWWRVLADHKETLIAIRNNCLNVYRNGCSIAKVDQRPDGKLIASVHYKFLLRKEIDRPYIPCEGGKAIIGKPAEIFISSLSDITDIRYWTDILGGIEKAGVHQIIRSNENVVDTEIALSGDELADENSEVPADSLTAKSKNARIDFCAVQEDSGGLFLRFFEAKDYSYKAALFAKPDLEPMVLQQLMEYRHVLEMHRLEILDAYKASIEIARQVNGTNVLGKNVALSALKELQVDLEPLLVVFGYDDDQKNGKNFQKHTKNLREKLNTKGTVDSLLLRGSPENFVIGISKTKVGKSLLASC